MLTIFAIPKAFKDHIGVIQENAILNWKYVLGANIILFGDELGVKEFSLKHNIIYIDKISKNSFGTPLVSDAFRMAKTCSNDEIIGYANSDVMFDPKLIKLFEPIKKMGYKNWMMVGQRIDLNIKDKINPDLESWFELKKRAIVEGKLHGKSGIDYFFFKRSMKIEMPEFAVGRPGWDNWMLMDVIKNQGKLINATPTLIVIHQNHFPSYISKSDESRENIKRAIHDNELGTISNCTHYLRDVNGAILVKRLKASFFINSKLIRNLLLIKRRFNLGLKCI